MDAAKPLDSLPRHWTDGLPDPLRAFAQLSRWDRPVGWRLLFIPCVMGLALARTGEGFFWPQDGIFLAAFLLGAIAMRGAGCTYNDIVDRAIDAQVERTRSRPLPAGRVTLGAAWCWLIAQALAGAAVLAVLPPPAILTALASLPLVAAYPFMKRITWWPQAWLGLCFSWGALVAGVAVEGRLTPEIAVLFAGCIAWVIAYDTIYALQDIEDDALVGVRSTARLFGARWKTGVTVFYGLAFYAWAAAAGMARAGWPATALLVFAAFAAIMRQIDPENPASALRAFKGNVWIGALTAIAFALQPLWIVVKPLWGMH
ncbi:MAG: 4-hydroxybenzoate octaprenyltransferase [Hyphomonadaceae bacterium]